MPPAKREAYDLRDYDVVVVAGSIMSREYSVARSGQLLRDSWHRIIIDSPHTCKSSSVLMAAYQALVAQCKWFLVTDYDMLPLNQLKQMEKFPKLMSFMGDLDQYTCWVDRKANETATTEAQSTDDAYSKPVSKEIEAKPLLAKCFNGSDHKPTKKAGDTKPTPTKIANNTKSAPTKTADDTKPTLTKTVDDTKPTLTKMANDTMPAPTKKTGDTKSAPTAVIPAPKPIMKQIQDQSAQPVALTEHFHCVGLIPEEERFYKRSPALLSLERKHIDAGLNDTEERADDKKDRSDGIVRSAFDQIVYAQLYTLYEIFHKRYGKPRTNRSSIEVTRSSLSEALKKTAEIIQKIHEEDPLAKMFVVVNKFADADVITKHLHDKTDIKNTAMKLSSLPSSRTKDLSMFALLDNLVVLFTSAVTDLDAISLPFVRHFIIVEKWWLYKDPASIVRVARDGIKEHEIKVHRVVYTEPVVQNTLKVNFRKRFLDDSYRAFRPMIALMEYANWGVPDTKEEVGEQT
ncbi:hypothetical protein FBU59_002579 [Linderina macrospora]|uniref:Uncharacterized protein n=1 Tax=Linderina macrospora TaxID=4868 RepID=A0ACC1JAQ6_9FUNG|nr:hypothetical protein FBU59_002579 [Linderina macrospora]